MNFIELENVIAPATRDEILALIAELYAVEMRSDHDSLAKACEVDSRAVSADVQAWLLTHKAPELRRGAFAKAIDYALAGWAGLTRFLDDTRIPLDNYASERALRGPVLCRKNHDGSTSARGNRVAALLSPLCESAKLADLDPRVYLCGEEVSLPHEVRALATAADIPRVDA